MERRRQGYYYDGKTARRKKVFVTITPHSVRLTFEDGSSFDWKLSETTQTQGFYEGEPIRIERGDESFTIDDMGFVEDLMKAAPASASRFKAGKSGSRFPTWTAFAAAVVIASLIALYLWGIPSIASYAADAVTPSWEDKLGANVVAQFTAGHESCSDAPATEQVDKLLSSLNGAALPHPYTFKIYIVKDPTLNAFAAPGGHIVIFTGLLKATKSPDELAGVMAHEMQHVLRKHATKSIFENLSTYMIIAVITGDTSGVAGMIHTIGAFRYGRLHEQEADERAVALLQNAGINPAGLVEFFKTMEIKDGDMPAALAYLSTHPMTGERIEHIRSRMVKDRAYEQPLNEAEWKEIIKGCAG